MMRLSRLWFCSLVATGVLGALPWLTAADAPSPPAPTDDAALRIARYEAPLRAERARVLAEAAVQAATNFDAANKLVAEARSAKAAAFKALAESLAASQAALQAELAADTALTEAQDASKKAEIEKKDEKAIQAAKSAVESARKAVEAAAKQWLAAVDQRQKAEVTKATAEKSVLEADAALKSATEAKTAADLAATEGQGLVKLLNDRIAAFEKGSVKPDPAAVRLVQTIATDCPVLACRFAADGGSLYGGARKNEFYRWDAFTGGASHSPGHDSWIAALAFLPAPSRQIVTGGYDGMLIWWDISAPAPVAVRRVEAHRGSIRSVAVSPDGQLLATGGNDNAVRVWSATDGTLVTELTGHARHVYNVVFDPSGRSLVSGDLLGMLRQWEVGSWTLSRELEAKVLWKYDKDFKVDVGGIQAMDFSPDGKTLAVGGFTEVTAPLNLVGVPTVVLIDWESGKQLLLLKPKENFHGMIRAVRFHPSGEFLIGAGGGATGCLWFWKPNEEKSVHHLATPTAAFDLTLHPDGLRFASPHFDNTIRVYDLTAGLEAK